MYLETEEQLRELYGFAKGRAKDKVLSKLERHSINFIQHSPFVLISTYSASGAVDCSPRGGTPNFVRVPDSGCIVIPDAKGNNRIDSLVNIVQTGKVGCLFLIPGVDETLRINGAARISTAAKYLNLFSSERNPPKACIEIEVEEVFLHCAKALMRSELWSADAQIERSSLPTVGKMINDQLAIKEDPEDQDSMIERYKQDL